MKRLSCHVARRYITVYYTSFTTLCDSSELFLRETRPKRQRIKYVGTYAAHRRFFRFVDGMRISGSATRVRVRNAIHYTVFKNIT
jgi:hypothetical protein